MAATSGYLPYDVPLRLARVPSGARRAARGSAARRGLVAGCATSRAGDRGRVLGRCATARASLALRLASAARSRWHLTCWAANRFPPMPVRRVACPQSPLYPPNPGARATPVTGNGRTGIAWPHQLYQRRSRIGHGFQSGPGTERGSPRSPPARFSAPSWYTARRYAARQPGCQRPTIRCSRCAPASRPRSRATAGARLRDPGRLALRLPIEAGGAEESVAFRPDPNPSQRRRATLPVYSRHPPPGNPLNCSPGVPGMVATVWPQLTRLVEREVTRRTRAAAPAPAPPAEAARSSAPPVPAGLSPEVTDRMVAQVITRLRALAREERFRAGRLR